MPISTPEAESFGARTHALLGTDAMERLAGARVLVVGVGGVGGYTAEMLARSGVGHLTIVDADDVAPSNINRQLVALHSTIGQSKVKLFAQRFRDINPQIEIVPVQQFVTPENVKELLAPGFDFVADCIDTVAPKVALLEACLNSHTRVISSMGAGGRLDPSKVCFSRLWETKEDGLARAVRAAFKKRGYRPMIPVVYSPERPRQSAIIELNLQNKKSSFGTLATIPAIFGIFMANYIITHLSNCR